MVQNNALYINMMYQFKQQMSGIFVGISELIFMMVDMDDSKLVGSVVNNSLGIVEKNCEIKDSIRPVVRSYFLCCRNTF